MRRKKLLAQVMIPVLCLQTACTGMAFGGEVEGAAENPVSKILAQYESAEKVAEEGIVLLENEGVLPMAASGNVALFGEGSFATASTTTESVSTIGDMNFYANISDAFAAAGYTVLTTADSLTSDDLETTPDYVIYTISRTSAEGSDRTLTAGSYYLTEQEIIDLTALAARYGNVILVLNTCSVTDFYNAYQSIENAVPGGIGAVVYTGIAGEGGGNAVVNVLNNTTPASGKLADTWAINYEDYPSSGSFGSDYHDNFATDGDTEYYYEGIYNGYRYFDTFNVEAAYNFGYGLSYTDFEISDTDVSLSDDGSQILVSASVTNTGSEYSGKETVQVYFSYNYNASEGAYIETEYQELAGYAKTDILAPGESQTVTVVYDTVDMASYDEATDQYVLQQGSYLVRVGDSSDHTQVAAELTLDEKVVTRQCTEGLFEDEDSTDAENLEAGALTYANIEKEELSYKTWDTADAPVISLPVDQVSMLYEDVTSVYDESAVVSYISTDVTTDSYAYQSRDTENNTDRTEEYVSVDTEEGYTLVDVYDGTITMEQLVASMGTEELADIVTGLSSEQTDALYDENSELLQYVTSTLDGYQGTKNLMTWRFIPQIFQSDGPEGCGVTLSYADIWEEGATENEASDYAAIRLPAETVMAQTWNVDLVTALGNSVGEEMIDSGLSIWLAPGANIHRNPLNGRNYQYYSEDPYLSGSMLTAEVSGVQSNEGVFCCAKHFTLNNMETNRGSINEVISERALREIYLTSWEMCVESEEPNGAFMTAYNQINGTYCGESYDLCTALLRGEWDYDGLIMDDYTPFFFMVWRDLTASIKAGNDLVMPGNTTSDVGTGPLASGENPYADAEYEGTAAPFQSDTYIMMMAIDDGTLLLGDLQTSAARILNMYMETKAFKDIYEAVKTYGIEPSRAQ